MDRAFLTVDGPAPVSRSARFDLFMILLISALVLGLPLWGALRALNTEVIQPVFSVYESAGHCQRQSGNQTLDCEGLSAQARALADTLNWPFQDGTQCASSYGEDNCLETKPGQWQVRMAGFTQLGADSSAAIALPVFFSSIHPGHYLPNGYPVVIGLNTASSQVIRAGSYLALQPRSLSETLCLPSIGQPQERCGPLYDWVGGISIDNKVVRYLFNPM